MQSVWKVMGWLSSSAAAALLALAVLAAPSNAWADETDATRRGDNPSTVCAAACTDTCPNRPVGGSCRQDASYCRCSLITCNCDEDTDPNKYACWCNI